MNVEKFKTWLSIAGAEILKPTNEYEVLRFKTPNGVSIIYKNKKGIYSFQGESTEAYASFKKGNIWLAESVGVKAKKRKRKELIERDGCNCFFCGKETTEENRTIEHLLSVAHGGNNSLANLVLACHECNQNVGDMPIIEKVKYRELQRMEPRK